MPIRQPTDQYDNPDHDSSLPTCVRPTGDDGVYWVKSFSGGEWYRCDATTYQCNCARAEKGKTAQARKRLGYLPFELMCKHMVKAIAYDQMLMRMERIAKKYAS